MHGLVGEEFFPDVFQYLCVLVKYRRNVCVILQETDRSVKELRQVVAI